ncbi:MAG: DUF11 domain-containing protein [Candidatus Nomurabacteria bacterium]|nr:MAG: DUF11 domain-containing protein [Candidatus Nomurabacteria bacterium]
MRTRQNLTVILITLGLLTGGFASAQSIERPTQTQVPIVQLALDGPSQVDAGATFTYTLRYSISDFSTSNVVLSLALPARAILLENSGNGAINDVTQSVEWSYSNKEIGDYTETATFSALTPAPNGTEISFQATLDSDETEVISAQANSAIMSSPKLEYRSQLSSPILQPGGEITVTLTIDNSGSDDANGVQLHEVLPEGLHSADQGELSYSLGTIPAGQQVEVSYPVRADAGLLNQEYIGKLALSATNVAMQTSDHIYIVRQPLVLGAEAEALNQTSQESAAQEGQVLGAETELSPTGMSFWDWLLIYAAALLLALGVTTLIFAPHSKEHDKRIEEK